MYVSFIYIRRGDELGGGRIGDRVRSNIDRQELGVVGSFSRGDFREIQGDSEID